MFGFRKKKEINPERVAWHIPGGEVQKLSIAVLGAEHCLIAGTTGCGKSTLLHGIMGDLLKINAPSDARLVLIDPKRVELSRYKGLPHCKSYTQTPEGAVAVLREVEVEMMSRYTSMERQGVDTFCGGKIYVVIDELAPLMISEKAREIRWLLQNVLQLGRAAGVHVIACTQAPNRKIIPAELVLNFSMRIGMRCLSPIESRQIIGAKGCEVLPRYGKALVAYYSEMRTASIPNTDRAEVAELVDYWQSGRSRRTA